MVLQGVEADQEVLLEADQPDEVDQAVEEVDDEHPRRVMILTRTWIALWPVEERQLGERLRRMWTCRRSGSEVTTGSGRFHAKMKRIMSVLHHSGAARAAKQVCHVLNEPGNPTRMGDKGLSALPEMHDRVEEDPDSVAEAMPSEVINAGLTNPTQSLSACFLF